MNIIFNEKSTKLWIILNICIIGSSISNNLIFSLFAIILFLFFQKSHHLFFFHTKFQFSNVLFLFSSTFQFTVHYFSKNLVPLSLKVSIFLYFNFPYLLSFVYFYFSLVLFLFSLVQNVIDTNNIILQSEWKYLLSLLVSFIARHFTRLRFFSICWFICTEIKSRFQTKWLFFTKSPLDDKFHSLSLNTNTIFFFLLYFSYK